MKYRAGLLIYSAIACVSLTYVVCYSTGIPGQWHPALIVIAFLYSLLVVSVSIALLSRKRLPLFIPLYQSAAWQSLTTLRFRQTHIHWILAILFAFIGTLFLFFLGQGRESSQAVWLKILLDSSGQTQPDIQVSVNGALISPQIQWQPYPTTVIALRSASNPPGPLEVMAIETDQGTLHFEQLKVDNQTFQGKLLITNPAGSLISWPSPTRIITLTVTGSGTAEVLWNDLHQQVVVAQQPTQLVIKTPSLWQGWLLLPPQHIWQLGFKSSVPMKQVDIFSDPPQSWQSSELRTPSTDFNILPDLKEINQHNSLYQHGLSILKLTLILFISLVVMILVTRAYSIYVSKIHWMPTRIGSWANMDHKPAWPIMLAVWLPSLLWHLGYAFSVPTGTTDDSPGYLAFAHILLETAQVAHSLSDRSPGYPLFLALIIRLFGENPLAIIICQHLLLSLLAPLTVWAFAKRLPLLGAGAIGLAVGFLPAASIITNVIHTEALYLFCTTVALLVYGRCSEHPYGLLTSGIFVGMATLIRPTGALLLVVLIGWHALHSYCLQSGSTPSKKSPLSSGLLLIGYLMIAAPWHIHLGLVRNTFDISDGRTLVTRFDAAVSQRRIDPDLQALRPDRAVWKLWMDLRYQQYTDPFRFQKTYPLLMTGVGQLVLPTPASPLGHQMAMQEILREADLTYPDRLHTNQKEALIYNLFLRLDRVPSLMASAELSTWFVPRWSVPELLIRSFFLRTSMFVLNRWWLLALAALSTLIVMLAYPSLQVLMPMWLYWLALVLSTSAIGMPSQRYIVVVEPLLITLILATLFTVITIKPARRSYPPQLA